MVIDIDVSAITNVGIVATVGNILMGGFGFIFFSLTFLPATRHIANRTAKLQAYLLSFSSVWVLACMIPYMVFFMNDSANVKAFIGQIQLPAAMVAATAAKSGHSTEYQTMWYLRLLAIFPWLSIASGLIAVVVLFKAAAAIAKLPSGGVVGTDANSKESVSQEEKV